MRGGYGCLVDLGLFGLAWIFPPFWFVIIPLWCYEGIVCLREYYYKYKMNVFLRNELSRMTRQEIEEKRIAYLIILQSPYATQSERATAEYVVRYIERHY